LKRRKTFRSTRSGALNRGSVSIAVLSTDFGSLRHGSHMCSGPHFNDPKSVGITAGDLVP
jgi:hypothetical protein